MTPSIGQTERPRRSDQKMNELKLSWEKKVSLREIAQFYEDKLRDLQAKNDILSSSLEIQLEKTRNIEERIKSLSKDMEKAESGIYLESHNILRAIVGADVDRLILNQNVTQRNYEASLTAKWHVSLELFMNLFNENDELRKMTIAWLKLLRDKGGKASQLKIPKGIKESDYRFAFKNAVEMAIVYLTEHDRTLERMREAGRQ
jgi:hypothetical protein